MSLEERELKLAPVEEGLLDRLETLDRLGPFEVGGRRRARQRNAYFDTATGALAAGRLALRRRVEDGGALATWTLKGEGRTFGSVAARPEIELTLDADTPPVLALAALRDAARARGAAALAEQVADALVGSPPPLARPIVELDADRRLADLVAKARGWRAELALDRVLLVGDDGYLDLEIEVELKRGDDTALTAAEDAIARIGSIRPSSGSKLSRVLEHLRRRSRR